LNSTASLEYKSGRTATTLTSEIKVNLYLCPTVAQVLPELHSSRTLDLYWGRGGAQLKSVHGYRLSWPKQFLVFLSPWDTTFKQTTIILI